MKFKAYDSLSRLLSNDLIATDTLNKQVIAHVHLKTIW